MNKDNFKLADDDNGEINELILKFRQCADAASQLSDSVEKFTGVYSNIEKNISELKKIDNNINNNENIKSLLEITDSMKDIFQYFKINIPELSKYMQLSKNELDTYKEDFQFLNEYFKELPNQLQKVTGTSNLRIRDKVTEDIKSYLDVKFEAFQKETIESINNNIERIVTEKLEGRLNDIDRMAGI